MLPKTADVVIIGAGIVGSSIAYHLAKMGCQRVVVLEKDTIGSHSSSKCAGGIRQQWNTEIDIRMSQMALKFFQRFQEEMWVDPELLQVGYLILWGTEPEWALALENVALQKRCGVPVEALAPAEIKARFPYLRLDDVVGGTFCPEDGYLAPYDTTMAFAQRAKDLGAAFHEGTEAIGIRTNSGRVVAVQTAQGEIATPVVVNAAGAYGAKVAQMVGVDLPMVPRKRHLFVTQPLSGLQETFPIVIDYVRDFSCRRERQGLMLNDNGVYPVQNFDASVQWDVLPSLAEKTVHRLPMAERAEVMNAWACLRDITPDEEAILGRVPELEGFILANGFSGHGFMHAPVTGQVMAEVILGKEPTLDISPLSLSRFQGPAGIAGVPAPLKSAGD